MKNLGTTDYTIFSSYIKGFNQDKAIDYTKWPLALEMRLKWDIDARLLPMVAPMFVHYTWSI